MSQADDIETAQDAPTPAATANLLSAVDPDTPTSKILHLLRAVHNLTVEGRESSMRDEAKLEESLFVNNKLTAKLGRQLEETMIIAR